MTVTPQYIIDRILSDFSDIHPKSSWGETSLFYNPRQQLPHGVYFCTLKEKDGDNDKASNLDRHEIYRLNIGIPKTEYSKLFGMKPQRPSKGETINTGHDFAKLNDLIPHPIYGWMSWVCILSPNQEKFDEIYPLIKLAYESAVVKFNKKTKQ